MMQSILALPKPVVAEVGGIATAAGCQLVASCDIVVAADTARFGVNGIDVGLFCSTPMVALSRNVGAEDGARHADDRRDDRRRPRARRRPRQPHRAAGRAARGDRRASIDRLLARPPHVLALGKRAFYEQLRMPLADAYRFASATIVGNMLMDEAEEGIAAFIEKRKPEWRDQ